ncbi:MAG TPA: O-antigen ligase family protein [Solirubrobacteraceae bacterium]|nr:O-antigen ligase family protein [Solirubrobacteraceae bacterium]
MGNRLMGPLRRAPATVPGLVAVALFIVWATDQAGYPVTHWAPGALLVLALLGVASVFVGLRPADMPPAVLVAVACLAAYTAFSFLSILWASVPGDAWEGADRTLLYFLVFALFACWPQRGDTAALLLGGWTLAMAGFAVFVALHISSAGAGELTGMFGDGRLIYPSGYANANAAQWLMAFWPAVLLARSERLPWWLRGALAGGAVVLAEVALLSQSRGSLFATPIMLILVFALLPARARTFVLLVAVGAGVAAAAPAVLDVGDHLRGGAVLAANVHDATVATLVAGLVVGLLVAAGAAVESRRPLAPDTRRRVHRAVSVTAIVALVAALVGGLVAAGDPVHRVRHAWDTFKSPRGYAANATGNRLIGGLGSYRYDFYRVALDEFSAHPLGGIGADNFAQPYLARRHSHETPHYPHSVELRTLAQTGLVGTLLALVGLIAALIAAARAVGLRGARDRDPLAGAVAAAALSVFAYWLVHGSFDWFFEFAGLGAAAFAFLGLACALSPRRGAEDGGSAASAEREGGRAHEESSHPRTRPGAPRALAWAAVALVALAAGASLVAPWFSGLEIDSAASIWTRTPLQAYQRLDDAARLDPLSDEANLVAGSIALRFNDLDRAEREFGRALERVPGDAYATLELGAIASSRGHRAKATRLLERAVRLNPRDPLTLNALREVREGRPIDVAGLNRSILEKGQQLS